MKIEQAMQMAIEEAKRGAPYVSPNPLVGCVVLNSQGELISKGHHEIYGGPHAEVNALHGLSSEQLSGAHIVVTLEPCAHEGKTPSCAKALAKLPVKKVTYGLVDPNPLVAGQGAQIIADAGIEVELFRSADLATDAEIKADLEQVCEVFLKNFREKKVFVALKMASSLDGQIALKDGTSQWITGPASREYVHYLRSCYDAVLVGVNTFINDDPSLNVRHPKIYKNNKVIVLDPQARALKKLPQAKLLSAHEEANHIIWCVSPQAYAVAKEFVHTLPEEKQPTLLVAQLKEGTPFFDLEHLMEELWRMQIKSIMIEGGGQTASAFLQSGWVDRLLLFQAPILLGAGISWTSGLHITNMQDKMTLFWLRTQKFAEDVFITGRVKLSKN